MADANTSAFGNAGGRVSALSGARGLLQESRHVVAESHGRRPAILAVALAGRPGLPRLTRLLGLPRLLRRPTLAAFRPGRFLTPGGPLVAATLALRPAL